MNIQNKPQKVRQQLSMWTSRAVALFFSVLLLSESTVASVGGYGLKIAQQTVPTPSIPLNADKQQRYQEGIKLVQEAQELEKKGTKEGYQQAIEKYKQVLKIFQGLGLREEELSLLVNIASVYNFLSDNKNAIEYFKRALDIAQELKQPISEAFLLGSIGVIYSDSNQPKEALTYLEKAQSILLVNKEYGSLATTLSGIANVNLSLGNTKEALYYQNEALKIYREIINDSAGEAKTLQSIAIVYSLSGETKISLNYYEQALKIQRERKDFPAEIEIIIEIAALQEKLGNTKKALESLTEALKLQEQAGFNLEKRAYTLAKIGHVYVGQDYRKAINYYEQAGNLFHKAGNSLMESKTLQMIGNVHKNFSGDYDKALEFLDKALKVQIQIDNQDEQALTLGQKADIYVSQGNYQQAVEEYNQDLRNWHIAIAPTTTPNALISNLVLLMIISEISNFHNC